MIIYKQYQTAIFFVRGWCPHQSLSIQLVGTPTEDNAR